MIDTDPITEPLDEPWTFTKVVVLLVALMVQGVGFRQLLVLAGMAALGNSVLFALSAPLILLALWMGMQIVRGER